MGLLFLGFPWSVLSVIGLPGTAFPEKLIERVFKQQYQPSNCFAWYCCDLQNDQRRQQEKQKAQNNFPNRCLPEGLAIQDGIPLKNGAGGFR